MADPLQTPVAPELPAESNATPEALPAVLSKAWVTLAAIGVSAVVFLGLAIENNYQSWDTLGRWGYPPAEAVWRGAYWALITSAFVHLAIWHLAFSVYWLVVLGARMERAVGSLTYLAFFLAAAIVSSAWQIGVSGVSGHGASGVGYAIFGFMWISRDRFPVFRQVLDKPTINLFLAWLIACIVATYLKVWIVGNAAHVTGMVFGMLVAASFGSGYWRRIAQTTLAALIVGAVVPLYWAPWSVQWLTVKAYDAHVALRYDDAVNYYSRIIKLNPDNAWAYINRSLAYRGLGDVDRAEADREKALALDPAVEQMEK